MPLYYMMTNFLELLKVLRKKCQALEKLLVAYEKNIAQSGTSPHDRERDLVRISDLIAALPDFDGRAGLQTWLETERKAVETAKDEFRFDFGRQLKERFAPDGLDIRGQYPKLHIGPYTLTVNFEFGECELWLGPEIAKIKDHLPLDPAAIHDHIKRTDNELRTGPFDAAAFDRDLRAAYRRRLLVTGHNLGDKLPLLDILQEFIFLQQKPQFIAEPRRENYRGFTRAALAFALYRFMKTDPAPAGVHFHVATFDATADKKNALWIPSDDEGNGTHFSHLSFDR